MSVSYHQRSIETVLASAAATFPVIVVTGPRQSGKTTLLKHYSSKTHRYFSLEDPDVRQQVVADPRAFLGYYGGPLFLDEIQYVPELFPYIKTAVDENAKPGFFLMSGSQHFPLMNNVSESLAGRAAILTLLPFGWLEFFGTGEYLPRNCPEKSIRGWYPQLLVQKKTSRDLWYGSYIQTYLERDIRNITNVGDISTFERFLRLLAGRTGQLLNMNELGREAGVSSSTTKRWISLLETGGQIFLLQPYHRNFGKRIVKTPKIYFIDTGIATYLFGLHDEEQLAKSPYWGNIFETLVIAEWVKLFRHRGLLPPLYFWRDNHGDEIDLVVDFQGELHAFEIKSTQTPVPNHASNLVKWKSWAGPACAQSVVLCNITGSRPLYEDIPARCWVDGIDEWQKGRLP
ncbi:MAG: ATP-binding protein [Chitinispirillaceae bacterium]|nr:ATP-binding protein [Chitinispirillaceae bacterium]